MKELWLDRYVHSTSEHDIELHVFADASQTAYAAVIYLKSIDRNGEVHMSLLIARKKIAPLKGETIPRLELIACLLAAKLLRMVVSNIGMSLKCSYFCWTDSQVAFFFCFFYKDSPQAQLAPCKLQGVTEKLL